MHPDGLMFTPYGATEALPIASIESREVLGETALKADSGQAPASVKRFSKIDWKVIQIHDGPLSSIDQVSTVPRGAIGELMVSGDVISREYVTRTDQNAVHKVQDGNRVWHRMGTLAI